MRLRQARKILRKATCGREDTWARAKRRVYGQPTTHSDRVAPAFADLNRVTKRGAIAFHKLRRALASIPPGHWDKNPIILFQHDPRSTTPVTDS